MALSNVAQGDPHVAAHNEERAAINKLAPIDLTTALRKPFFISHRGGHLVYGEHSQEAYEARARQGFAIEPDVNILSDGGLACIHDATTSRTMVQVAGTPQVNVNQITSQQFIRDYRILPELEGSPYEMPTLFPDVLDQFGGRVLICPEMKDVATRVAVCDAIVKRGLQKAVIAQSFNFADVQYSASLGIVSAWLTDTGDPASMVAAGIKYAAPSTAASTSYVDSCRAAGLGLIRWTVNSRATADSLFAANRLDGVFTDDPEWVSGQFEMSYTDPFRQGRPWPHMITYGDRPGQIFRGGGIGYKFNTVTQLTQTTGSPNDWCLPLTSGKAKITFTVDFGPNGQAQNRWVGLAFGKFLDSESPYFDSATAGQTCHHMLMRRNGSIEVFENFPTGVTQKAVFIGTELAAPGRSTSYRFQFVRDATSCTLTNLTNGQLVSWGDSTNIFANARHQFNFNGTDGLVKDVVVEPIP